MLSVSFGFTVTLLVSLKPSDGIEMFSIEFQAGSTGLVAFIYTVMFCLALYILSGLSKPTLTK